MSERYCIVRALCLSVHSPFCIWATFFEISRMISRRHFSHLDTSVHSEAKYGRRSLSPVSASFAARHRASVVLEGKKRCEWWLTIVTSESGLFELLHCLFCISRLKRNGKKSEIYEFSWHGPRSIFSDVWLTILSRMCGKHGLKTICTKFGRVMFMHK